MTDHQESNRLPVLAAEIKAAHSEICRAAKVGAEQALAAGRALVEAKQLVRHGEWLPFLAAADVHERTAQRLMALAASNIESDTVSLLGGVMPALRFLRLRGIAADQLTQAEIAAREGKTDGEELVALEVAMEIMAEMIGMFPEQEGRHSPAGALA